MLSGALRRRRAFTHPRPLGQMIQELNLRHLEPDHPLRREGRRVVLRSAMVQAAPHYASDAKRRSFLDVPQQVAVKIEVPLPNS